MFRWAGTLVQGGDFEAYYGMSRYTVFGLLNLGTLGLGPRRQPARMPTMIFRQALKGVKINRILEVDPVQEICRTRSRPTARQSPQDPSRFGPARFVTQPFGCPACRTWTISGSDCGVSERPKTRFSYPVLPSTPSVTLRWV